VVRIRWEYLRTAKGRLSAAGVDWPTADLAGEIGVRPVRDDAEHPPADDLE